LKALLLGAAFNLSLATNHQYAVIGGHVDVLRLHAWQIRMYREVARLLMHIDCRRPARDAIGIGGGGSEVIAKQLVDVPVHAAHQSPRFISHDRHKNSSSQGVCAGRRYQAAYTYLCAVARQAFKSGSPGAA